MGIVTDHVADLIRKQVELHRLVVWYDPDGTYADATDAVTAALAAEDGRLARYSGSFLELRHQIEPQMQGTEPPRLVLYVPLDRADSEYALVEAEAAGVVVQPGEQPPTRNSRLSVAARNALEPVLGATVAAQLAAQADDGKLSLAELDAVADRGNHATQGVTTVVFGSGDPCDVALRFLSSDAHDVEVVEKDAMGELGLLLEATFGIRPLAGESPRDYRSRLTRFLLVSDLRRCLGGMLPAPLRSVEAAAPGPRGEDCSDVAGRWRNRFDLRESYIERSRAVEAELPLDGVPVGPDGPGPADVFLGLEYALQRRTVERLLDGPTPGLVDLARARQSAFWATAEPEVQAEWALVETCGRLLLEADRIEAALKGAPLSAEAALAAYADGDQPWCLLDAHHRHMERRHHTFDFHARHDGVERLVARCRHRYVDVGGRMAEAFVDAYQDAGFEIPSALHQADTFDDVVRPSLDRKTAYVWVDALRYEMARELKEALGQRFEVDLRPALAAVPTVTHIGMAALLPGARSGRLVEGPGGKLVLEIGGVPLTSRADRVKLLAARAGVPVYEAKLEDLLPKPKRSVERGIEGAQLVLVTSQEIDSVGEGDNIQFARQFIASALYDLQRAVRVLADLGVERLVFTADHGFLFADEVGEDMKLPDPDGDPVERHRRAWIGRGGTGHPAVHRAPLGAFGIESDLEAAFPRGFSVFKVRGGARAYFHGGLSPQELVVPIGTVELAPAAAPTLAIEWALEPGSEQLSTRFFSVQVRGRGTTLFGLQPPRVRVEIRAKGQALSTPISASYGFDEGTGDVQLRLDPAAPSCILSDTVTLMVTDDPDQKTVSVHLTDASTGAELATLSKLPVAIAI